jgi:hypothetical protein
MDNGRRYVLIVKTPINFYPEALNVSNHTYGSMAADAYTITLEIPFLPQYFKPVLSLLRLLRIQEYFCNKLQSLSLVSYL